MTLEGIFIEPTSTTAPDLSLHISPPSISSSLISNTNYEPQVIFPSQTVFQAHTELSLGRNFTSGRETSTPTPTPAPRPTPPPHSPYYPGQTHFHHLLHSSSATTSGNTATSVAASANTPLNHINYGVSLLDVSSSDGLRPIKGIPVYHNRSFPFVAMDHARENKDPHNKMCLYHHVPSYPALSSSCSSLCSTTAPSSSPSPYFVDPMSFLNNGSTMASRAATASRFNGFSGDAFKSHPLHQYGVGSSDASSMFMRSRFMSKLPNKRSMRAPRMRWTSTLHARFVHAVELLGGHESKQCFFNFLPF